MDEKIKPKVMIVDDMVSNISLLTNLLKGEYEIFFAKNGVKALEIARKKRPDVILLDVVMPDMDGYEVCSELKGNPDTRDIPVIFVTAMVEGSDESRGFEIGAADYIKKPFKPTVIKARVAAHARLRQAREELRRLSGMALDANPMTGLGGANSAAAAVKRAIREGESACIIHADLDNLKAFNNKYGYARGDEVILFTAQVLKQAVADAGCVDAFVGHTGSDDFVLALPSDMHQDVVRRIMDYFDGGVKQFYSKEDASAGCIASMNRQSAPQAPPIISISIAGVDLSYGFYNEYIEVNDVCTELKKKAKAQPGSFFCLDRRLKT